MLTQEFIKQLETNTELEHFGVVDLVSNVVEFHNSNSEISILIGNTIPIGKRIVHYARFGKNNHQNVSFNLIVWGDPSDEITYHVREVNIECVNFSKPKVKISKKTELKIEDTIPKIDPHVMDALNDVVVLSESEPYDKPGPRVLYVNKAFTQLTGYNRTEIIGKTPRLLQGIKTEESIRRKIREGLSKWQLVRVEITNYKKNGEPFIVELSINPVADFTGWYTHWVSIQRDITLTRQEEVKMKSIVNSFPGSIYQFKRSPKGEFSFTYLGPQGFAIYEIDQNSFQENPNILSDMVHPDDKEDLAKHIQNSDNVRKRASPQGSIHKWTSC